MAEYKIKKKQIFTDTKIENYFNQFVTIKYI